MLDRFNREISYLRISVTDRCNLRCEYCMPEEGIKLMDKVEILSIEEMAEVARVGAGKFGIRKVRLTGGEPLVRLGIVKLVELIKHIPGIDDISMSTNGTLLDSFAYDLKKAGLDRVNISLDSLSPEDYRSFTRGGEVTKVIEGIRAARRAGLTPVKINVVRKASGNNQDISEIEKFCQQEGLELRQIEKMNLRKGSFAKVKGGSSGDCPVCNRLRLMSNGNIKPCLFSNKAFNIRTYGIEKAFLMALEAKPRRGQNSDNHQFYNIGG